MKPFQAMRHYSLIEGIQEEHEICYSAFQTGKKICISLSVFRNGEKQEECCHLPETNFNTAKQLALFLYENSVGTDSWINVLEDLGVPLLKQ